MSLVAVGAGPSALEALRNSQVDALNLWDTIDVELELNGFSIRRLEMPASFTNLFENGIVHISSDQEESTTHLQNCEILWQFETEAEDRSTKVRLLRSDTNPDGPKPPSKPTKSPTKTI